METQHIAPEGHPVHTLMEEHSTLLDFTAKLLKLAGELKDASGFASSVDLLTQIKGVIDHFKASQKHYLREENVIFPYLEKHGIAGPPKQMWAEHDQIRDTEKELFGLMDNAAEMDFQDFAAKLELNAQTIAELLAVHYNKENTILFPMAMQVFTEDEWQETIRQFNEIGYCCFSPKSAMKDSEAESSAEDKNDNGMIDTGSGSLTKEELLAMLNSLPVEITFVDKDDTFRYFNKIDDPIFVRTVASVGTKVQNCHPQKSVHMVNKILADFKSGVKDMVSFWIHLGEKYVYIRYFAVRDQEGKYLGCMEVTMDINDIQQISSDKRLID